MGKILIVDDSLSVRESLRMILKDSFSITASSLGEKPISLMKKEEVDLVILGITHPLDAGIEFLQRFIENNENVPVLLLMERQTPEEVIDIFDHGIFDFVFKPFSVYNIREKVQGLLSRKDAVFSLSEVSHKNRKISKYRRIYKSPFFEEQVATIIARTLDNDVPVLIQSEKGLGQELIAKIIHYNGLGKDKVFFKINCVDLTEESFVNTLLTMTKGASLKSLGTLFLEDIESAGSNIQMRLMDIIEEQAVIINGKEEVGLNPRVIASASMDLLGKVNNGEFREDLFYRLNTIPISLSPLRERREDIPVIADYFLNDLSQRKKLKRKRMSLDAVNILKDYYWPGNLIELESVMTRSAILTEKEIITDREISFGIEDIITGIPSEGEKPEEQGVKTYVKSEDDTMDLSLNTLITNLAHEFKNPLVSIKTFSQLLPERFEDAEFRGQFFNIVRENVDRIDSLIEGVIDYAQFSKPEFRKVNVRSIIEKALENNLGKLVERKSVVLKEFEKDLPLVVSDKDQLLYIFDNVLSNAISMVQEGSDLSLSARVSNVDLEEMSHVAGLERMDSRVVEVTIPLSDSKMTILSLPDTPLVLGLELFLAEQLVNSGLGIMDVNTTAKGGAIIKIKLPVAFGERAQ